MNDTTMKLLNLINKVKYNKLKFDITILKTNFLFLLIIGLFSVSAGENIKKFKKQKDQITILTEKLIVILLKK